LLNKKRPAAEVKKARQVKSDITRIIGFFTPLGNEWRLSKMVKLEPNRRTIERFLGVLTEQFDTYEQIEIRCLRENYTPHTARYALHSYDQAVDDIIAMNATHNVYVVVNPVPESSPLNAKDKDIGRSFFAFVDADDKGAADRARSFDAFEIAMEVITGTTPHLRNHIYYRFDEPVTDMQQWKTLQRALIQNLGTDAAIHNPSRIMRVAGTVSYPSKAKINRGYKTELTRLIIGGQYAE
jgi:hypothetical protein